MRFHSCSRFRTEQGAPKFFGFDSIGIKWKTYIIDDATIFLRGETRKGISLFHVFEFHKKDFLCNIKVQSCVDSILLDDLLIIGFYCFERLNLFRHNTVDEFEQNDLLPMYRNGTIFLKHIAIPSPKNFIRSLRR